MPPRTPPRRSPVITSQQLQQGEQEPPDRVDHSPVDPEDFHSATRLYRLTRLKRRHHQVDQLRQARDHVRPVDAGQDIVDARRRARGKRESVREELVPLERLVNHEEYTEGERRDEGGLKSAIRSATGEREGEDHGEPAREEDDRVESAPEDVVDLSGPWPDESREQIGRAHV